MGSSGSHLASFGEARGAAYAYHAQDTSVRLAEPGNLIYKRPQGWGHQRCGLVSEKQKWVP